MASWSFLMFAALAWFDWPAGVESVSARDHVAVAGALYLAAMLLGHRPVSGDQKAAIKLLLLLICLTAALLGVVIASALQAFGIISA